MNEASEKVREAADSTQEKLREQVDQRSSAAGEKVTGTAHDLRSVGEELRRQGKDTPARMADRAAEQSERLGSYLKESDADKILGDVEDFGRRQPLAVLAGGVVLGVAAARFLKASSRGRYQNRSELDGGATRELRQPTQEPVPPAPAVPAGTAAAPAAGAVGR